MLQRLTQCRAIAAITCLLSIAIFDAGFTAAQAQSAPKKSRAASTACGKELLKQCSGQFVFGNTPLECLKKNQEKFSPRCVALANEIVRRCDRDAAQLCQGMSFGQGNVLGCLTTARRSVSARCNAALDAAYLRQ